MKLGMFTMPLHTMKLGYKEMYDQDMEAALLCDRLGFAEYWLGEHTAAKVEPISDALQFMSALIPQTRNLVFGTGVLNLPQHFPPKVAADVALFDHMSNGRFLMGVGPGGLPSDFELYGTTDKPRGEMMIECVDMIHKIWTSDPPYELAGKFWNVRIHDSFQADLGIGPMPKPFQTPYPPVYTSAMNPNSGMARLAGTRGWGLISANFNATWVLRTHWEGYAAGAEQAGRRPDRSKWRVARSILITDSEQQAADYLATPGNTIRDYYNYLFVQFQRSKNLQIFKTAPDLAPEAVTLEDGMAAMAIVGTARRVTERLVALVDEVGPFGGLLMAFHEWDDKALWQRSMQLLAGEVMPALARHAAAKLAA
ncbi:MAG: LLM class flavin-dependent oxidoreductase [Methylobacteriaceae bacterium]|nr:LLM class flavin-dependent oxidoreductase [Methylobacteriaceae bacterium]